MSGSSLPRRRRDGLPVSILAALAWHRTRGRASGGCVGPAPRARLAAVRTRHPRRRAAAIETARRALIGSFDRRAAISWPSRRAIGTTGRPRSPSRSSSSRSVSSGTRLPSASMMYWPRNGWSSESSPVCKKIWTAFQYSADDRGRCGSPGWRFPPGRPGAEGPGRAAACPSASLVFAAGVLRSADPAWRCTVSGLMPCSRAASWRERPSRAHRREDVRGLDE